MAAVRHHLLWATGIGISYESWIGFGGVAAIDNKNCAGDLRFSDIDGNTMVSIVLYANNTSIDSQVSLCKALMHQERNPAPSAKEKTMQYCMNKFDIDAMAWASMINVAIHELYSKNILQIIEHNEASCLHLFQQYTS